MKMWKRALAVLLSLCMVFWCLAGCGTASSETETASSDSGTDAASLEDTAISLLSTHGSEQGKEETVYILADADGNVTKKIVSSWLKNPDEDQTINDVSDLDDISNVSGDETYTADGENLTWNAEGDDIIYQGTSEKDLPIDVKITYTLDGQTVTADQLAGASGHLVINYSYTNNTASQVKVDGKEVTMYQPFLVISGMALETDKATNITVTNGKVVNTSSENLVLGLAMPGLADSLGLNDLKDADGKALDIDIPEDVTIEADVTDFSLLTSVTVYDNSALNELDLDDVSTLDDLKEAMDSLADATDQLIDGSEQLNEGTSSLKDGTSQLKDGASTLASGISSYTDGASQVNDGIQQLVKKVPTLTNGIKKLASGTSSAYEGSGQLLEGMTKDEGILNGALKLKNGSATLNKAINNDPISLTDDQKTTIQKTAAAAMTTKDDDTGLSVADQFAVGVTSAIATNIDSQKETIVAQAAEDEDVKNGVAQLGALPSTIALSIKSGEDDAVAEAEVAASKGNDDVSAAVTKKVTETVTGDDLKNSVTTAVNKTLTDTDEQTKISTAVSGTLTSETEQTKISTAVNGTLTSEAEQTKISTAVSKKLATEDEQTKISTAVTGTVKSDTVQSKIASSVQTALQSSDVNATITSAVTSALSSADFTSVMAKMTSAQQATFTQLVTYAAEGMVYESAQKGESLSSAEAQSKATELVKGVVQTVVGVEASDIATTAVGAAATDIATAAVGAAATDIATAAVGTAATDIATTAVGTAATDIATTAVGTAATDIATTAVGTAASDIATTAVGTAATDIATAAAGTAAVKTAGLTAASVIENVADQVENNELLKTSLTDGANKLVAGVAGGVASGISASINSDATKSAMSTQLGTSLQTVAGSVATSTADSVVSGINKALPDTLGVYTTQLADGNSSLYKGLLTVSAGVKSLNGGLKQLDSGMSTLSSGSKTLASGVNKLGTGSATLVSNNSKLNSGASTLAKGTVTLDDGAKQLLDGSKQLVDGLKKFNDEGIAKLEKLEKEDLEVVLDRLKALQKYAKTYSSFSGAAEDEDSSVRFIMRTDSIDTDD